MAVQSGSLVIPGPAGNPPVGLRAYEAVGASPVGVLVRPAGSVAYLRNGGGAWLNFDGTAAGWVSVATLAQVAGLAGDVAALGDLADISANLLYVGSDDQKYPHLHALVDDDTFGKLMALSAVVADLMAARAAFVTHHATLVGVRRITLADFMAGALPGDHFATVDMGNVGLDVGLGIIAPTKAVSARIQIVDPFGLHTYVMVGGNTLDSFARLARANGDATGTAVAGTGDPEAQDPQHVYATLLADDPATLSGLVAGEVLIHVFMR